MTDYEIYVILLCVMMFGLLTALSVFFVGTITRLTVKLIRSGAEDEQILAEHRKKQGKKSNKTIKIIDYTFSGIVCFVLVVIFAGTFFISCTENADYSVLRSEFRVVRTGSMATKNPKNTYLTENQIDDQIQTFDVIRTERLPDEMELELYDIVVYEMDGILVIHRIVEIEEPNESHPDHRHFRLQGDAVDAPDRFPVLYEQMHAIYRGTRIPFVGSFVLFLQSPPGWVCIMLVVFAMIVSPILEDKLEKERQKRLLLLLPAEPVQEEEPPAYEPEPQPEISARMPDYSKQGRVGLIGTDTLDAHYQAGETVDMHSLKQRKLIPKNCKRVKIVNNGAMHTPLIVRVDGVSSKAREIILRAGGQVIKSDTLAGASAHERDERHGGDVS